MKKFNYRKLIRKLRKKKKNEELGFQRDIHSLKSREESSESEVQQGEKPSSGGE